ncbi:hypothetical protein QJS10_CPA05g00173 [Acorus calamus]|uniref:Small ribosomal subunit protein mS41 SAM domain-containing protein n=1 Tax=Acorus calamus TaxID=4465 RepID=A0AAV9EVF5_ACOCL|nr:hypothetical protein QJS10_CPA05g00173 [Acorus calamus]
MLKRVFVELGFIECGGIVAAAAAAEAEKVGIQEFLNGVGKGVETHIPKIEAEIGDFEKLLVTRTLRLKKLGIPCKHA